MSASTIRNLILSRAEAHGIKIVRGKDPQAGEGRAGSRAVIINGRIYNYRGNLETIGLRLNLITQDEIDTIRLAAGELVQCPHCGRLREPQYKCCEFL